MSKEKSTKLQNEILSLLANKIDSKEYSETDCCGAIVGAFSTVIVSIFQTKQQALDFVKFDTMEYIEKAFDQKRPLKELVAEAKERLKKKDK